MRDSSSNGTRMGFGAIALTIAFVSLLAVSVFSTPNASANGPVGTMDVKGYIYDESFDVVGDADVTVTTKDGETVMASYYTTSGVEGYYQVTFGLGEYDFGCTVEVTATDGVLTNTNSTVAVEDALWNFVNVTLSTEIPEFGGVNSISMIFAVSGIIAIFIVMGRKKQ